MFSRLTDFVRERTAFVPRPSPTEGSGTSSLRSLPPGTPVSATVVMVRGDGSVRAHIAGEAFDLRLPFPSRAGDTVALRVLTQEPRLQFTLPPDAEPLATATALSDTARFITSLLARGEQLRRVDNAAVAGPPLLDQSPSDGAAVAHALESALGESGLFYEAHLAEWVSGQRSLADLRREPQARLRPRADSALSLLDEPSAQQARPVHGEAMAMVQHQLETLESGCIRWKGDLWPGQSLDWEISRDSGGGQERAPADQGEPAKDAPVVWCSKLRLELPKLGPIDAIVRVSPNGTSISVRAARAETAGTLEAARSELRTALAAAGIVSPEVGVTRGRG